MSVLVQFSRHARSNLTALAAMAGWHLNFTLLCGAAGPPLDLLEAWSQLFFQAFTWICLPQFAVTAVVSRETMFGLPLFGSILHQRMTRPFR